MLLGIISDTHGDVHRTWPALRLFESLGVHAVLHCGDIGSADVVALFSAWPTHFVFGNTDREVSMREAILAAGQTCHERFGTLEIEGRRIALLHGNDQTRLRESIQSGRWDLICHGHTHHAEQTQHGRTLVVNPGAIARTTSSSAATIELPSLAVTTLPL